MGASEAAVPRVCLIRLITVLCVARRAIGADAKEDVLATLRHERSFGLCHGRAAEAPVHARKCQVAVGAFGWAEVACLKVALIVPPIAEDALPGTDVEARTATIVAVGRLVGVELARPERQRRRREGGRGHEGDEHAWQRTLQ